MPTPDSLDALAQVLEALRATRARLEKRRLLVGYLQALPDAALPLAVTYLGGRPFPRGDGRALAVGGATLEAAYEVACEIENLAGQYLQMLAAGLEPVILDDDEMRRVMAQFARYGRYMD